MVQAGSKAERSLMARVEHALDHADPDIRALAEAILLWLRSDVAVRMNAEAPPREPDA